MPFFGFSHQSIHPSLYSVSRLSSLMIPQQTNEVFRFCSDWFLVFFFVLFFPFSVVWGPTMRLCQMARAGIYVVFPFPRIGIIVFFSLLEWDPAVQSQLRVCIHRMNYIFSPY